LPNHSKERHEAEVRFKRAQKPTQDPKEASMPYESDARAVRAKIARLKTFRLAKQVTDVDPDADEELITSKATLSI
jgi:hypothetical protein